MNELHLAQAAPAAPGYVERLPSVQAAAESSGGHPMLILVLIVVIVVAIALGAVAWAMHRKQARTAAAGGSPVPFDPHWATDPAGKVEEETLRIVKQFQGVQSDFSARLADAKARYEALASMAHQVGVVTGGPPSSPAPVVSSTPTAPAAASPSARAAASVAPPVAIVWPIEGEPYETFQARAAAAWVGANRPK